LLGPALGGGHGLQQGKHGLTSDHFVNLNVVLANGTAVTVNETSHPDLWWAMRGAGHNFCILTSVDSKIWPDNFKTYFVKSYQFGGSSLDAVLEQVTTFQGNGTLDPAWLASFGLYTMNTTLSDTQVSSLRTSSTVNQVSNCKTGYNQLGISLRWPPSRSRGNTGTLRPS
jgi:FAD/FMN-containing dehydrogenase